MVVQFHDYEPGETEDYREFLVDQLEIQQFSRALLQEIRDAANRMTYASRTVGATPWRGSTVEETLWVEFAGWPTAWTSF